MLDPNNATFEEVDSPDDAALIIVGQLAATQAVTIDARKLAASDVPRATIVAEAKRTILLSLWKQIYGELGSGIEAIHTHARQTGSLATLQITRPLRELLRPEVQAPAPETIEKPPREASAGEKRDAIIDAFICRFLARLKAHGIDLDFADGDDEPAEILANAIAGYVVTLPGVCVDPASGIGLIATERRRQLTAKGYTTQHDDAHDDMELIAAADAYLEFYTGSSQNVAKGYWPWEADTFNPDPCDRVANLTKAGALIAAEIDRLQRQAATATEQK